jgi:hypothetical protein
MPSSNLSRFLARKPFSEPVFYRQVAEASLIPRSSLILLQSETMSHTSDLIEHTDALGRTKYISRDQLREERQNDREITDMRRNEYDERSSRYSDGSRSPSPESKQARFQNIDDGDVRGLGVGYYNFSADESMRRQQMSILDTLRASTEDSR